MTDADKAKIRKAVREMVTVELDLELGCVWNARIFQTVIWRHFERDRVEQWADGLERYICSKLGVAK